MYVVFVSHTILERNLEPLPLKKVFGGSGYYQVISGTFCAAGAEFVDFMMSGEFISGYVANTAATGYFRAYLKNL